MKNPKREFRSSNESRAPKPETNARHTHEVRDSSRFTVRLAGVLQRCPPTASVAARSGLKSALRFCRLPTSALWFLASGLCLPAFAQNYSIDWHTIDGGGGTSTGGVYSVTGTIGQPDANTTIMTGGNFTLTGGFWSLIAIQTPGAPTLKIVPAGAGQAQISWSPDTRGYVLQETLSLSATNWINSASGTNHPVTVPVPGNARFYRLFKP